MLHKRGKLELRVIFLLEVVVDKTAAIVVSYLPDIAILSALLDSLRQQVHVVILVDNGGGSKILDPNSTGRPIEYLDMCGNAGLGAALNAGFRVAMSHGVRYVVTFDQDSQAHPTLIQQLAGAMQRALDKDSKCVAVSPTFYDRRVGESSATFPFYRMISDRIHTIFESSDSTDLISADVLITSGMYVRADIWLSILKYDETMFVDFTDTEWCFRARDQGYSLYGCSSIKMGHALSDAPPIVILGRTFFKYSPVRRYFYFRNAIVLISRPYVPAAWRRRFIGGLALRFIINSLIDDQRIKSIFMMTRGIYHGLRKRLGPLD